MADGSLVPSTGVWTGTISWGPINVHTSFEVFPSGGSWRMLIGKPLLEQVQAIQDYGNDAIMLPHGNNFYRVSNFVTYRPLPTPCLPSAIRFPSITNFNQPSTPSLAPNLTDSNNTNTSYIQTITPTPNIYHITTNTDIPTNRSSAELVAEEKIWPVLEVEDSEQPSHIGEVPDLSSSTLPDNIFTRLTEHGPFLAARVEAIIDSVRYGNHLTGEQRDKARALVAEFADIFALSVREVKPVDFVKFCLQIPPGTTFGRKIQQRPLTKPQREYLFPVLNDMRDAGITRFIKSDEVKAVASTVLVQKAHSGTSLSLEDI
jgi:hypothetical protein